MKTSVRVALIGARGRMGQTIADLAKDDPKIDIVAQCDLGDAIDPAIKDCDVAIDFSNSRQAIPAAPAPLQTSFVLAMSRPVRSNALSSPAEAMMAVPCWSS